MIKRGIKLGKKHKLGMSRYTQPITYLKLRGSVN